jgi:anoctamin-10
VFGESAEKVGEARAVRFFFFFFWVHAWQLSFVVGLFLLLLAYGRESDFVYGLPVHDLKSMSQETELRYLTPANRVRLVYSYVTSHPEEGGLDIAPLSAQWTRVQSILALHDPSFDSRWIKSLTRGIRGGSVQLDKVKDHASLSSLFTSSLLHALIIFWFVLSFFLLFFFFF